MSKLPQPKPRRIAFVSDAIYPYHKGGKETRLHEITQHLATSGHEVHVYTMNWWNGPPHIQERGIHLHAISPCYPLYTNNRRSMRQAIMFGLATFRLLNAKFDVIDVDSMPFFPLFSARLVCLLRGKHMHASWHEVTDLQLWHSYVGRLSGTIAWIIERGAMLMPNVIISNSQHTTRRLRAAGSRKPIVTIPLGMHLQDIYDAKPSSSRSDVIFLGRLLSHKNVNFLIQAIALVKTTHPAIICHIIGDGPEKARLTELITKLQLQSNVMLLGGIEDNREVYGRLKASRVFVQPSIREGFGLVVIEAHAAGLPVITTPHTDNAARDLIIRGVNGYLAEPTPEALAEAIRRVLDHPTPFEPTTGISQYDWKTVATRIEATLINQKS